MFSLNDEWYGWSRDGLYKGKTLHIGPLPGRKSICLYTMDYTDGAIMKIHAYFRNEKEAKEALATLEYLLA